MTINKDKVVALEYTLTVNGEVIESVKAEKPLRFIFGAGTLLPKFEENVLEKSVGDAFEFRLEAVAAVAMAAVAAMAAAVAATVQMAVAVAAAAVTAAAAADSEGLNPARLLLPLRH